MSSEFYVFLRDKDVPTRDAWQQALNQAGIDLVLDEFDVRTHSGFLPAVLNGKPSGFEYFFGTADAIPGVGSDRLAGRDRVITFVLHADMLEVETAEYAAAALTQSMSGLYYDPDSDQYAEGAEVFEIIRRGEEAAIQWAKQRAERDASLTDRRCPQCGSPCPTYRKTCKACGLAIGRE